MRIAVAVFGFLSLIVTLALATPSKFLSQGALLQQVPADTTPQPRNEALHNYFPKGDRLAIASRAPEVEPEPAMNDEPPALELADNLEVAGPPLPPPDLPVEALCHTLASVAVANGLPTGFFARLIWQESRFNQRVVSHAGAQGVAQFMPAVAAERGLLNPFDPLSALPHSARFLKEHLRYFGNLGLAAAAYNAGARRVTDWLARRGRLPDETRQYVKIITGNEPERWIEANEIDMTVALPRQNPCEGVADLSRDAEPARVAVQLEPQVQKLVETARMAAARAAAEAKARRLAASLKTKRGRAIAGLHRGKQKAKETVRIVAAKAVDKLAARSHKAATERTASAKSARSKADAPKVAAAGNAAKLPPKITDRLTDSPKRRVRVAETATRR